ncbi:MAG: hypothetical protein P1S60_00405 [Anaerolineae bacterium]|nr:hypothetical protein [Anaerolineae bacterium]
MPRSEDAVSVVDGMLDGLRWAVPGTYLLVGHPAYTTDEMRRATLPGQLPGVEAQNRDWRRRMFMDDIVLNFCQEENVCLISYTEV